MKLLVCNNAYKSWKFFGCVHKSHCSRTLSCKYFNCAGKIFSELISSMDQSGAKYGVLYVSDPSKSIQYPSYRELQRFLAESASGNASANSTACDEVCQIKSSLLEGLLVVSILLPHFSCFLFYG